MQLLDAAQAGQRLNVSTPHAEVEAAAATAEVLILEFDAFRDGRGFSLASSLRDHGFRGRLIAAGNVLPDQARHLRRSGFDAVELSPAADVEAWRRMDEAFSAVYQSAADDERPVWNRRPGGRGPRTEGLDALAERLNAEFAGAPPAAVLSAVLDPALGLKTAAISSFGAESAVLLHLIAETNPDLPVIFLETGQHFLQTLSYRAALTRRLGLADVRIIMPDPAERAALDARDDLWRTDADACCDLRKIRPLARAAVGFSALVTGRKRYQNGERATLRVFEVLDGVLRVNPLADWTADRVRAWLDAHELPLHPLVEQGYASIGCWPCTRPSGADEDARAGRWSGMDKTECGIHLGCRRAMVGA